jgi:hypothetical protein
VENTLQEGWNFRVCKDDHISGSLDKLSVLQISVETWPKLANSDWDNTKPRNFSFGNM